MTIADKAAEIKAALDDGGEDFGPEDVIEDALERRLRRHLLAVCMQQIDHVVEGLGHGSAHPGLVGRQADAEVSLLDGPQGGQQRAGVVRLGGGCGHGIPLWVRVRERVQ